MTATSQLMSLSLRPAGMHVCGHKGQPRAVPHHCSHSPHVIAHETNSSHLKETKGMAYSE